MSQERLTVPWCSLGTRWERRRLRNFTPHSIKSFHQRRPNVWEYSQDDNEELDVVEKNITKKNDKQTLIKRSKSKNPKFLIFFLFAVGFAILYFLTNNIHPMYQLTRILSKTKFISFMDIDLRLNDECCHRLKRLTLALSQAEHALRAARHRKTMLLRNTNKETSQTKSIETGYIDGATAMKGSDTTEWGRNIDFWGVFPFWRNSPPPDTVLKLRRLTPSDCWPFRGSSGEIIIQLPRSLYVDKVSVEHIRPDTALSAPRHFTIYGILSNGTRMKAADGVYRHNKPARQYFHLDNSNIPFQRMVIRVLSNQGNPKYTCIYGLHFYATQ